MILIFVVVVAMLMFAISGVGTQSANSPDYIIVQHAKPSSGSSGGIMFVFGIIATLIILFVLTTG